MGVIVGVDILMFIGVMIMGLFVGWVIKKFDKFVDGKILIGFEMLVNNFLIGIIGMFFVILGFYVIGLVIVVGIVFIEFGV